MAFLFLNDVISSGIFTWRPMATRLDTVKTKTVGFNMASRNCMIVLIYDFFLVVF